MHRYDEQWKDTEFTRILCTFIASSKKAMDIHILKILLPIADGKTLALLSEFVNQLQTVQSLEVRTLSIMYNEVISILLAAPAFHFSSMAQNGQC